MAAINKPLDINKIWAQSGDVLAPSDTKISQGWGIEIPPRQYFNYIDGKQDQAIAHINQRGIAQWDQFTEYQANLSYTQGSNGVIYKCLITNTNINPVTDTTNSWQVAFVGSGDATQVASATQSRAMTANNVFISPLQLANAFTGINQLSATEGFQVLPGGLSIQWGVVVIGAAGSTTWTFPKPLTSRLLNVQLTLLPSAGEVLTSSVYVSTSSLVNVTVDNSPGTSTNTCYIMVIGI